MKKYYILLVCLFVGVGIVAVLAIAAKNSFIKANGFKRLFSLSQPKLISAIDLGYNSYYISGLTKKNLTLGNYTAPFHLMQFSHDLRDSSRISLQLKRQKDVDWGAVKVQLDSPFVYMLEYTSHKFIAGALNSKSSSVKYLDSLPYDLAQTISVNSLIIRRLNKVIGASRLQKLSVKSPVPGRSYDLTKQADSDFSTDGFFSYEFGRNRLFYTYYYRNQFICLDTNMNLLYEGRTIDTNAHAKIKTKELKSKGKLETVFATPPLKVNKRSYTTGNLLFINSALIADNQAKRALDHYNVIDIYDANTGKYHHSIQIANYQEKKLTDFAVYGNKIFVIFDRYLAAYNF